jgi:Mce-associated membrane protein
VVDDPPGPETPGPVGHGRADAQGADPGAVRARPRALPALAGLAVLLLVAVVVLGLQVRSGSAAQTARRQATEAAEQQAVNVTSVSSTNAAVRVAQVLDAATGNFRTAYEQQAAALQQNVEEQQVTASGRVIDSGVVRSEADRAVVLVVVEATVANRAQPAPTPRRYRLQLGLERLDSRWLTSSFEMLD